jgi:hypothetical protein
MSCRGHALEDSNYVNIGMRGLIADRHEHPVPIEGRGNLGEKLLNGKNILNKNIKTFKKRILNYGLEYI